MESFTSDSELVKVVKIKSRPRQQFCESIVELRRAAKVNESEAERGNGDVENAIQAERHGEEGFDRVLEFVPDASIDKAAFLDCDEVYRAAADLCHNLLAATSRSNKLDVAMMDSKAIPKSLIKGAIRQLVECFVDVKAKEYGFIHTSDNLENCESTILLEESFAISPAPNPAEVEVLGWATQMGEQRVNDWFVRKSAKVKQLRFVRRLIKAGIESSVSEPAHDAGAQDL